MWIISRTFTNKQTVHTIKDENDKVICTVEDATAASLIRSTPVMKKALLQALSNSEKLSLDSVESLVLSMSSPAHSNVPHTWVDDSEWDELTMAYNISRVFGLFPIFSGMDELTLSGELKIDVANPQHFEGVVNTLVREMGINIEHRIKDTHSFFIATPTKAPNKLPVTGAFIQGASRDRGISVLMAATYMYGIKMPDQKVKIFVPTVMHQKRGAG